MTQARIHIAVLMALVAGPLGVGCASSGQTRDAPSLDDVLESLRTASQRTPTLTGTIRTELDTDAIFGKTPDDRTGPSNDRSGSTDAIDDRILRYTARVWLERPSKLRQERDIDGSPLVTIRDGSQELTLPVGRPARLTRSEPDELDLLMFTPIDLASMDILDTRVEGVDVVDGRPATRVIADATSSDRDFSGITSGLESGDRLELWVDQATGLLLRLDHYGGDKRAFRREFVDLQIGVTIPPEMFSLTAPPGVEVLTDADIGPRTTTLAEAARILPFGLWAPVDSDGATVEISRSYEDGEYGADVTVPQRRGYLSVQQGPAGGALGPGVGQTVVRGGLTMTVGNGLLWVTREDTQIVLQIAGRDASDAELIEIATSLVRVAE